MREMEIKYLNEIKNETKIICRLFVMLILFGWNKNQFLHELIFFVGIRSFIW